LRLVQSHLAQAAEAAVAAAEAAVDLLLLPKRMNFAVCCRQKNI
jgi:hypothetical protein